MSTGVDFPLPEINGLSMLRWSPMPPCAARHRAMWAAHNMNTYPFSHIWNLQQQCHKPGFTWFIRGACWYWIHLDTSGYTIFGRLVSISSKARTTRHWAMGLCNICHIPCCLVVQFHHLEKYESQLGRIFPYIMEHNPNVSNYQSDNYLYI